MRNKLLLTTAIVAGFVANANALEYTPYVSAKAVYGWMKNDMNYRYHYVVQNHPRDEGYSKDHKDNVWGLRLAAGLATPVTYGKIRTELEFGWNDNAKDLAGGSFSTSNKDRIPYNLGSKLSIYSAMINVYYDFDTHTAFMPYVGAGFGIAHLKNTSTVYANTGTYNLAIPDKHDENYFAWNIGLGVNYALNENISVDLGYKYSNYGKISAARWADMSAFTGKSENGTMFLKEDLKVDTHEVLLGVRYNF